MPFWTGPSLVDSVVVDSCGVELDSSVFEFESFGVGEVDSFGVAVQSQSSIELRSIGPQRR